MLKNLRLFALLMFLLPLSAFARSSAFTDPDPVPVPAKLSVADVEKAVKGALTGYRWTIKPAGSGKLEALYTSRDLMAKISVSYNSKEITIKYLDSSGLDYQAEGDKRSIHPTYQRWISNLVKSMEAKMTQAEFVK
jgi:hypothetical protein